AQFQPGSLFAQERMDAVAVLPVTDSSGETMGLLVAMGRQPLTAEDAERVDLLLTIAAARAAAEVERARTDETLRAVALAVSESRSGSVFEELVRLLATILQVEVAFVAQPDVTLPGGLRILAMRCGDKMLHDIPYP